ncbi:unnamed protein product [Bemisia tabaci]|uniref:Uncharacterized protein n=1 Tax=Bemisia tabaci TaxID=7038 RepID=A0A9P0F7D6_BEMTA|nr:unnamed protein product [Bemisia tabaci]
MEETEDGKSCKCTSHNALYFVIKHAGGNVSEFKKHENISLREAKKWLKRNGFKLRFKVRFPDDVILSEHPVPARGEEVDPATETCKEACQLIGFVNLKDDQGMAPIADGFVESFKDEFLKCGCAPYQRVLYA